MKLLLPILFISLFAQGQYGNQDSVILYKNVAETLSFPALVHDVSNKAIKHPVFIYVPGRGHNGRNITGVPGDGTQQTLLTAGPCLYLKTGWAGIATNPVTLQTEEYLVISTRPGDYGLDDQYWDGFLQWLYYVSPYKNYIDTNRVVGSGVSAGRGCMWYSMHLDLTPSHKLNWNIMIAPEVTCCDAMNFLVSDSVRLFGAGVTIPPNDDSHADQLANEVILANQFKANYAVFRSNPVNPCPTQSGHCNAAFNYWYDPSTDTTYIDNNYNFGTNNQINIYQIGLLYSQAPAQAVANSITTLPIPVSTFCVNGITGQSVSVSFNATGVYNIGNQFKVELSSPSGSFVNPTLIGTGTTSPISCTVPANSIPGTKYRIRVTSTLPAVNGTPNTVNLTVVSTTNSISPTATQNIAVNGLGNTLTVSEGSPADSRQWYDGSAPIAGATGTTYIPTFPTAGSHSVTCHSVYISCNTTVISNAVTINVAAVSSTKHYLTKGADNGASLNACNGYQYNPYDTFIVRASLNPWSYITFKCFHHIVITNEYGVVLTNFGTGIQGGFSFSECTDVHLTGTGDPDIVNGFEVKSDAYRGVGVNIDGRSDSIEVDHLDIHNKNAGMWVKMEQAQDSCNPARAFPQWYINHINIHDNYIHNNAAEGIYGLSTAPNGNAGTQHAIVYCNGVPDTLLPMRGYGWKIRYNVFDSNGRAAIQVSAHDLDTAEIAYNTITRTGWDPDIFQGNGISLGTYCRAYVHDNYINWTKKDGIQAFGALNWIQNNTIHNSGDDGMGHTSSASNIYIASQNGSYPSPQNGVYDSTKFVVRNNDLDSNSSGYNVFAETGNGFYKATNIICGDTHDNNFVRPGINYASDCSTPPYIIVADTIKVPQIYYKSKTFHRDSISIVHADSANITITFFAGGKPINRHLITKVYGLEDTLHFSVPYDSLVRRTRLVDSVIYDTIYPATQLGIFYYNPSGTVSFQHVMDTANYIGVNWLRLPYTRGGGNSYNVATANANGFHTLVTFNNSSNGAAGYSTTADSLITAAKPDWITGGNEPAMNDSSNINAYLSDLNSLITVAHAKGVKVADGGFEKTIFLNYVKDLQDRGKTDSANTIISAYSLNMASSTTLRLISKNDSLLTGYALLNLDAVALHWAEPYQDTTVTTVSGYLPEIVKFLVRKTGKNVMITELGIKNHNCALLGSLVDEAVQSTPNYPTFYFDGKDNASTGDDIKLQDCFKAKVTSLK